MRKAIFYYATVMLFLVFEIAMSVSPSVMTKQLMNHFSITVVGLAILSSSYYYGYLLMQIPTGVLIDRLGVRKVIVFALSICAFSLMLFVESHSLYIAAFCRFLMGLGGAASFVLLLTVARTQMPPTYFSIFSGIALFAAGTGAIFGQVAIASLFNLFDWQQTLKLFSLIGLVLAVFTWFVLKPMRTPKPQSLQLNNIKSNLLTLFKNKQLRWVACFAFLNVIPLAVFANLWGIPYLQTACQMSVKQASIMISSTWLGFGLVSPFLGIVSEKLRSRRAVLISLSVLSILSMFAVLNTDLFSTNQLLVVMFLLGVAGSGQSMCFSIIKDIIPVQVFSTASSINNMAIVITPIIFQTLVGYLLYTHAGSSENPHYSVSDYHYAFALLPICGLLSLFVAFFCIKETHCKTTYHYDNKHEKQLT